MKTDARFFVTESRAIEIRYDDECPQEIRDVIQPLLERFLWIVPTFIHVVFVQFVRSDDTCPNAALSTQVQEEYRKIVFYVHPNFLLNTERGREIDVRHEFVHGLIDHMHTFCEQTITAGNFPDQQKHWLNEELRKALERVTCDIEHMIDRKLNGTPG